MLPDNINEQIAERARMGARFIRENYRHDDIVALSMKNRDTGVWSSQFLPAEKLASPGYQEWLRKHNWQGRTDMYISANAIEPAPPGARLMDKQTKEKFLRDAGGNRMEARRLAEAAGYYVYGRTKEDIGAIRHVYLDFDKTDLHKIRDIGYKLDIPYPHFAIETHPGAYHVGWRAAGFTPQKVEALQRGLAYELGADSSAVDVARSFRLPGMYNHKHGDPKFVSYERLIPEQSIAAGSVSPNDFPDRLYRQRERDRTYDEVHRERGKTSSIQAGDSGVDRLSLLRSDANRTMNLMRSNTTKVDILAELNKSPLAAKDPYYAERTYEMAMRNIREQPSRDYARQVERVADRSRDQLRGR